MKKLNGSKKKLKMTLDLSESPLWVKDIIEGVQEGMRHDSAIRLVGRWYGLGLCTEEIILALITWNKQNQPPLGNREFMSIIKSTIHWACPR